MRPGKHLFQKDMYAPVTSAARKGRKQVFERCGAVEDVQGVLTLFCSGAAQVCHALRVNELRDKLEVEEEDGDRKGGRGRSRKWRKRIKESAP